MTRVALILVLISTTSILFGQSAKSKKVDSSNTSTQSKPFVLGVIEELYSQELKENRILNIYLPEGYNANDTIKYPVIYLLDGSADEDFIHIVGLVQFNSFDWVNQLPKSIVVGIATIDRRRDFTFPTTIEAEKNKYPTSGGSLNFMLFIERELQPFIQTKYKTTDSKMIIGQSFGGLLVTEILFKKPSLFSKYIIVSPSLWWDNGSLLSQVIAKFEHVDVYIGVGKEGLTPSENPRVMEVDANLLADKLNNLQRKNVHVYFDYLPQENHATILHHAVFNAFRCFFSKSK